MQKDPVELGAQVRHPGPVWLDRVREEHLARYGFGAEVRRLVEQRREVLRARGIQPEEPARSEKLREMDRRAIGERLAARTGQRFVDAPPDGFRGRVRVVEHGGREPSYAAVFDGAKFVLVPATRAVRALEGKAVTVTKDREGRVVVRGAQERDRGS
jgi:hypothetical protein